MDRKKETKAGRVDLEGRMELAPDLAQEPPEVRVHLAMCKECMHRLEAALRAQEQGKDEYMQLMLEAALGHHIVCRCCRHGTTDYRDNIMALFAIAGIMGLPYPALAVHYFITAHSQDPGFLTGGIQIDCLWDGQEASLLIRPEIDPSYDPEHPEDYQGAPLIHRASQRQRGTRGKGRRIN